MVLLLLNLSHHDIESHNFNYEIVKLISDMENLTEPDSRLRIYAVPMGVALDEDSIAAWLNSNQLNEFDPLKEQYLEMMNEVVEQISALKKIYMTKVSDLHLQHLSIKQLDGLVKISELRLKRLRLCFEPDYSLAKGKHTRSGIEYEMIRAYWYQDNGEMKRIFNKNVGQSQMEIEKIASKLFEFFGYETLLQTDANASKRLFDLIITKDEKKWIVEIKETDRKRMITTYLSMELWKKYKTTYGLD